MSADPDFDISDLIDDDGEESNTVVVKAPSGMDVSVMGDQEADFYNEMVERYMDDNRMKNVSDFLELDRLLLMETMSYRWGQWLLSGEDYFGRKVSPVELQKSINLYSKEIREIKAGLGLDKVTRDKDKGTNFAEYMTNLHIRAKEFGVHRNNQVIEAINILNKLFAQATAYKNMNDRERKEFNVTAEEIVSLILSLEEDYNKIDEAFRESQKIWIRTELNKDL